MQIANFYAPKEINEYVNMLCHSARSPQSQILFHHVHIYIRTYLIWKEREKLGPSNKSVTFNHILDLYALTPSAQGPKWGILYCYRYS